jgi:hypothetical protein
MTTTPDEAAEPNDSNYTDVRVPDDALPEELATENDLDPSSNPGPSVDSDVAGGDVPGGAS